MAEYIALLHKDDDSDYGVSFPDLPGCVTAGSSLEEARKEAVEALALHLEGLRAENLPVPEPSELDSIIADPEYADQIAVFVVAPAPPTRRVNVTFGADVLEEIDRAAAERGMTRSAYLALAAIQVGRSANG